MSETVDFLNLLVVIAIKCNLRQFRKIGQYYNLPNSTLPLDLYDMSQTESGVRRRIDWLALHLKVGSGIDKLFLEIIRSYVDKFNIFFIMLTILKCPPLLA